MDLALIVDGDMRALIGSDAGPFDIAAKSQAKKTTGLTSLALLLAKIVIADHFQHAFQAGRIIATIIARRQAILEGQAHIIGKLIGLDKITAANLGPFYSQLVSGIIEATFDGKDTMRSPGATIGADRSAIGINNSRIGVVIWQLIGTGKLAGRNHRDNDAIGAVGASIMPETIAHSQDAS